MSSSSASEQCPRSAITEAIERAKQVASKLKAAEAGQKRPLSGAADGPESKRPPPPVNTFPNLRMMEGMTSEQVAVPDRMVGMIIGRGGEQITRLQSDSGCKIQMAPDSGGQPERMCTLTGTPQSIAAARSMIESLISGGEFRFGGGRGGGEGGGGGGGGGGSYEMMLPGHKVGLIIGKGGETIKSLQEQTGAKIIVIQDSSDHADQKPVRISGPPDAVEMAKSRIMELVNQLEDRNGFGGRGRGRGGPGGGSPFRGGPPRGGMGMMGGRGGGGRGGGGAGWPSRGDNGGGGEHMEYVLVPSSKVGLVIGKGGETIKSINQASGAFVEIDKRAPPDAQEKNFIIRGPPENVEKAKQMVLEKIGMAPGSGYGSFPGQTYTPPGGGPIPSFNGGGGGRGGGHMGGYDQQPNHYQPGPGGPGPAVNPATGMPDYSAQWAEYYRSIGFVQEAEKIEQQAAAARGVQPQPAAVVPAAPQAGGGGQDFSAQWAEYYRSIGKVEEAEAIEAQIRAKSAAAAPQPAGYPAPQFSAQPGYPAPAGYYPPQQGYPGYD